MEALGSTGNDRDIVVKAEKRESVVNATPLEIQLLSGCGRRHVRMMPSPPANSNVSTIDASCSSEFRYTSGTYRGPRSLCR